MITSYAQNFEDVILWRALKDVKEGIYIDVGAAWAETHSVTKLFYDAGWHGINVEPNVDFHAKLEIARPRDINLCCAAGNAATTETLFLIRESGLTTLQPEIAQAHESNGWDVETTTTSVTTLSSICETHLKSETVHFLKIDAEGHEAAVLRGSNWDKYRPWIVVIEATRPLSQDQSSDDWEKQVINNRYSLVYNDGLNRFYLSEEKYGDLHTAFNYPPNVFDDFCIDVNDSRVTGMDQYESQHEEVIKKLQCKLHAEEATNAELASELRSHKSKIKELNHRCSEQIAINTNQSAKNAALESSLNEIQTALNHSETTIAHYENSLSWRLTKPLRNLKHKLRTSVRSTIPEFPAKEQIEPYENLSHCMNEDIDDYDRLYLPDNTTLCFAKSGLMDRRGIGRVSRELHKHLKALSTPNNQSKDNRSAVYFYSSIHWCPDILPAKSIILVHDVIPLLFEEEFSEIADEWRNKYKKIAQQARKIVTISRSSAEDISKHLDISMDRIEVIYNGVSKLQVNSSFKDLPQAPYLVYLGSHDKHKNLDIIFEAFKTEKLQHIQLALIGNNTQCLDHVKALGVEDQIKFYGELSDKDAGAVIAHAQALLFPSLYEGFGLPPLEAALLETPSICSKRPAMTETLKNAALFADPNDPEAWSSEILRIVSDNNLREKLSQNAIDAAHQFCWEKTTLSYAKLFTETNNQNP